MAGRKLIIVKQIRASTILEVVVSMVIIVIVFGVAMMIYTNVTRISLSGQKIRAQAVLSQIMKGMEDTELSLDQESVTDGFIVKRSVKHYAENNKLLEVDLKAYDENHLFLAELHQLILQNEDK